MDTRDKFPKGAVVRHKVTGKQAVVLGIVANSNGVQVDCDTGTGVVGSERIPADSLMLVAAPADTDLWQYIMALETRLKAGEEKLSKS